jgi:thiol-disulfide isomerase/thioredoxin
MPLFSPCARRSSPPGRTRAAGWLLGLLTVVLASHPASPSGVDAGDPAVVAPFEAVLVNGGGRRSGNYQSHLLHLKQLYRLLRASGVPPSKITIFSSDGSDPAADLAVRDRSENESWLLEGTRLQRSLNPRISYVDSAVEGAVLKPATRSELGAWFEQAASRLRPGTTLLLYVTDHGTLNDKDASGNRITLWGKDQQLSVSELQDLIAGLDPGVRVVTLMSQCFSGDFAGLMYGGAEDGSVRGNVCGYFSSTAKRPAYGCYPENFDNENVGHSFRFIGALHDNPSFSGAHRQVLVDDATPDVPLKTSDVYLQELLERAAAARERTTNRLVDQLLAEAWDDPASWEPEIRLLDAIGQAFGFFSPRSMAELEEGSSRLPEVSRLFLRYRDAWRNALRALNRQNLESFLDGEPAWAERLSEESLKGLAHEKRKQLARDLLQELAAHAASDPDRARRLDRLKQSVDTAQAANYRMQVRLGVLLRLKSVLARVAGRIYLENHAEHHEVAAYASLLACESMTLPASESTASPVTEPEPFPSYNDDLLLAKQILPGWMGIRFRQTEAERREELGLEVGATDVLVVFEGSAAERAGIEAGDIVLGPPDAPFREPMRIREWIMTLPVGEPKPLSIRRGEEELLVTLVPEPYPIEPPALPGPPEISAAPPTLEGLNAYRGELPKEIAGPYLLFFWATWCGPCKAAVPELLAFETERKTRVIAITSERAAQLEPFFETRDAPFPETVAIDGSRRTFLNYGVNGTPSFVLVGEDGTVQSTWTGYRPRTGLQLDGWEWSGRDDPDDPRPAE